MNIASILKFLCVGFFLLSTSVFVSAGIRPSFYLEYDAWEATDIVVVTEGDEIDGNVTVLEPIKGNLAAGDLLSVPELAEYKPESSRLIKDPFNQERKEPPSHVSGSRMVLFLKRSRQIASGKAPKWEAANDMGMTASVAWIEQGHAYAFVQMINPGPSLLIEYTNSDSEFLGQMAQMLQEQESFNAELAATDARVRARGLMRFASSDKGFVQQDAFEQLRNCGDAALPVLREMLNDQSKLKLHYDVVETMTAIGGKSVGGDLIKIVEDEADFWRGVGPRLPKRWRYIFNEDLEIPFDHLLRLNQVLESLKTLKLPESRGAVIELRKVWRSLPPPDKGDDEDDVTAACNEILKITKPVVVHPE